MISIKINSSSLQELNLYKRGELLMNQRKSLKELNLLDKFLFDEAMDDPENVKTMLDIILSQNTNLKHPPQTEKEQRTSTDNRQIRLDVYAIDEDDVIYEVEAQKENTHNLPKRSRLYQGIIDSKLLPPGVVDFNLLNEVLIVLIMPFDLFGYGLYRYTFQMKCEEVPELTPAPDVCLWYSEISLLLHHPVSIPGSPHISSEMCSDISHIQTNQMA